MLLAIDTGNTQTVIGLFDGAELADHWRIATVASRTSDELALMIQQFLGFHGFSFDDQVTGVAVCSGVPSVTAALRAMTTRYFGFEALVLEPGVRTGMPILYDNPKEVGPGPHRRRGRRVRALRRADDRRRLRDREHGRGDQREGRVPRRRDLPWRRDLDGRAVRPGGRVAAGRAGAAAQRDRQVDRRVDPVGRDLRLQRADRRDRRPVRRPSSARARWSRPAGWPS